MFYLEILKSLYENQIKSLLVGGVCVNLYGVPRFTQDIDLIIEQKAENISRLTKVLKEHGYVPALPLNPDDLADEKKVLEWTEKRNLKAFSFRHAKDQHKVLDILLIHPLNFDEAYKNRSVRKIQDFEISFVSIDDLILMKEYSGRPQDLSDVEMLKQVKELPRVYNA